MFIVINNFINNHVDCNVVIIYSQKFEKKWGKVVKFGGKCSIFVTFLKKERKRWATRLDHSTASSTQKVV